MNLSRLPSNGPVLSVVIPVFNEKPVLPRLYERLHKALDSLDFQYEIVFVDDGSTDDSHRCRIPDVSLVGARGGLLTAREVLREVLG